MASPASPPPYVFYYLSNFERALTWLVERYDDLFDPSERAFFGAFGALPRASRALLVRMLMRKGTLFRASRLGYDEIGCPREAATPLIALGWVDAAPELTIDELFHQHTRVELQAMVAGFSMSPAAVSAAVSTAVSTAVSGMSAASLRAMRKADLLEHLRAHLRNTVGDASMPLHAWHPATADVAYRVSIAPLCERFRLMFFGNLYQEWSEFVLADLGVFLYERVAFAPSSRAFQQRGDVDGYLMLQACRETLAMMPDDAGDATFAMLDTLVDAARSVPAAPAWIEQRRAKLLFLIGQFCERQQAWQRALDVYESCAWPGARHRRVRVLERLGQFGAALSLAMLAAQACESEEETQRLARIVPRLKRQLGQPVPRAQAARPAARSTLMLARPGNAMSVEYVVRDHLHTEDAPVFYVENALINSLFGLLCWEAVFAALPGAFFHPFQRGPADLHAPDFHARRADAFAACFAQLDSDAYRDTILRHAEAKAGLQSPFVFWGAVEPALLALALDCLPAAHLKHMFTRLVADVRNNRTGFPDLIRFWPAERRYELIEVKGPGDRLQDNQIRWLAHCAQLDMPVRVLDVRWAERDDAVHPDADAAAASSVLALDGR